MIGSPSNVSFSVGQKWKHNAVQFELNRRFAREHNPDDESIVAGPGIYDNYKRQVNDYGEQVSTSVIADSSFPNRR